MHPVLFILGLLALYLGAGLVVAIAIVFRGLARIDPATKGSSLAFRMFILPGCIALWPLMLRRWFDPSSRPPTHTDPQPQFNRLLNAHLAIWPAIAVLVAFILIIALMDRPVP